MSTEPIRRFQCPERCLSLAGFQVRIIGRFWVTAEVTAGDLQYDNFVADPRLVQADYIVVSERR